MKYIALIILVVLLPQFAQAKVQISEVAWMGTSNSQYSEWIELYNDGDSSINLGGWKLYEGDGGSLVFTFTKTITAHSYLLLERTTASAPDAVQGISDESGSFGGGGLANTGEDLVLKDGAGTVVDELNYLEGWPAGDATTKQTMQWNGEKWITADPTPKMGIDEGEESSDGDIEEKISNTEEDPFPIPPVSPNNPLIQFTIPPVVYRGVSYQFGAQPILEYNFHVNNGSVYWNFGDGTVIHQELATPVVHTYEYAGTYTMYYSYSDVFTKQSPLIGIKKIRVIEPALTLSMVGTRAIELHNTSTTPVDLSRWRVFAGRQSVAIPDMTIVSEKSKVTIPLIALGLSDASEARIIDPSGNLIAQSTNTRVESISIPETSVEPQQIGVVHESDPLVEDLQASPTPIRNRTKTFIFGAVALFVIGLSILLERAMARREYQ